MDDLNRNWCITHKAFGDRGAGVCCAEKGQGDCIFVNYDNHKTPDEEVIEAVSLRLKSTQASLRSTEQQISASLAAIEKQIRTQRELADRKMKLTEWLKENGVEA